jgi:hypothetical protein
MVRAVGVVFRASREYVRGRIGHDELQSRVDAAFGAIGTVPAPKVGQGRPTGSELGTA